MEDKEIMTFKDEDGNKVEFEAIANIFLDEKEYLILSPLEGNVDDGFIVRLEGEDENLEYIVVDDDTEYRNVKKEYEILLYNKQ